MAISFKALTVIVSPSVLIAALSSLTIIVLTLLGAWHAMPPFPAQPAWGGIGALGLGSGGGIVISKLVAVSGDPQAPRHSHRRSLPARGEGDHM